MVTEQMKSSGISTIQISSLIDAYYEGGVKSFEEIAKSWRDDDGNYPGDYEQDLLNISRLVRQNKVLFWGLHLGNIDNKRLNQEHYHGF